jgi:hypothetical protein
VSLAGPVEFAGASYAPGQARATYTFNSYRLSYRYRFHDTERATAWVGFTAKVRDAEIALGAGDDRRLRWPARPRCQRPR